MKLEDLDSKQRAQLAKKLKTSPGVLLHLKSGFRKASADMASRIERAARSLGWDIQRESLCEACKKCELAKAARGNGKGEDGDEIW